MIRLGGNVYLKNDEGKYESISRPDILVQWIKDFRRNWFLKWGLMLIVFGSILGLVKEIVPSRIQKDRSITMNERKLKQVIGLILFLISMVIFLASKYIIPIYNNEAIYRLLICIMWSFLGIAIRAFFYIPFLKRTPEASPDKSIIIRGYILYFIMILGVTGLIYLTCYSNIQEITREFFYTISFLIFTSIGYTVSSAIRDKKI